MYRALLLDHFDSFTANVAQGLREAGAQVDIQRVDGTSAEAVLAAETDLLVLGPGPGHPGNAMLALDLIPRLAGRIPILGICLGHQILALAFGGHIGPAPAPVHGKACPIHHDARGLFRNLPDPLIVGRYHSLAVTSLPEALEACAWAEDGTLMALRHRRLPLAGFQFHPDSFLTPQGGELLRHALSLGH